MKKENNLPNVWNKAKINDYPIPEGEWNEGALWFSPNEPDKLKIFQDGKWTDTDPFEDLEERKVKK